MSKILVLVGAVLAAAVLVVGQMKATATDQSQNLIKNGLFESFVAYGDHLVGEFWSGYVNYGDPHFSRNGFELGQEIISHGSPMEAGIYQTVEGTIPGASYYVYVGTAAKWGAMDSGRWDGHIGRTVGADPYGGTDPNSPNVLWGSDVWDDAHWNWKDDPNATAPKLWLTAQSTRMTMFLKVMYPEGGKEATIWLDDAAIIMVAPPPPATPTPLPTSTSTPTPTPIPILGASATSLAFLAENPGDSVGPQTLTLYAVNGGQLSWSAQASEDWLSAGPTSGSTVPQGLQVSVNTAGLSPGRWTGVLTLRNTTKPDQPQIIVRVELYIGPLARQFLPASLN